jgi:hypothetical protein
VGLAETRNFAEGYDAIFGKKKAGTSAGKPTKKVAAKAAKTGVAKKKKSSKKK